MVVVECIARDGTVMVASYYSGCQSNDRPDCSFGRQPLGDRRPVHRFVHRGVELAHDGLGVSLSGSMATSHG
jgi:hypothetical protein